MKSYKDIRLDWTTKRLGKFPRPGKLIDVGAGSQIFRPACSGLEYTSLDNQAYKGTGGVFDSWASSTDIIADISLKFPIESNEYDYVICTEVFEHLTNPVFTLQEMFRITKVLGKLLITAPKNCEEHMSPYIYYSGFFKNFYVHWIKEFGGEIEEIEDADGGVFVIAKKIKLYEPI